ncbi:MAG: cyclic-di-AMP receptor [Armatimonadetes bacterium]|nr:cyclic-di-AMP receptor [Armatimonadota bacterium]
MKLIIAIAHERDKHRLADALLENGLTFTKLGSTGGFLRQGNVTVLIGVDDAEAPRVLEVIRSACGKAEEFVNVPGETLTSPTVLPGAFPPHPIKVETGGAVAFVLNVESFQRF